MRTRHVLAISTLACLTLITPATSTLPSEWHTPPEKWNAPRVYHTTFDEAFAPRIRIDRDSTYEPEGDKDWSPNQAYYFTIHHPNMTIKGPWNTVIAVFNERGFHILIRLLDHSNPDVIVTWINEKLLYINVWWGRIIGTSLIYDVENEGFIYKEMVHDGVIPFQQAQDWKKTHGESGTNRDK